MRLYRALLHLYPISFRNEYGGEMAAVFEDQLRGTGLMGRAGLWICAFFEIAANALAVHADILRQDLRYAGRALARTPGFAFASIVVVALGIGATTAAFSIADHVLLRPLPFRDPGRLVKLWERVPEYSRMELSPGNFRDWQRMSHSFVSMGAWHGISANLIGEGAPERVDGSALTSGVLSTLGVAPLIGRSFTEEDDRAGAPGTLILSYRLWQSIFGGDPAVLGRKIILDSEPYTVIGVMPSDFLFPSRETELWTTARFQEDDYVDRANNWLGAVGRLKPGVSQATALAELSGIAAQLERQFPKDNVHTGANVVSLRDDVSDQSRMLLTVLCGAALSVLLIAAANLANLLLARALARRQELAVRAAIGAGRERIVRQIFTECALMALVGGILGVALAAAGIPLFSKLVPNALPVAEHPSIDLRVLGFASLITALTTAAFGIIPAWRASSGGFAALRESRRAGGGRKARLRSALVIAEIAVSLVLLVSCGLLARALWRIQATDPGFHTDGVMTLRTALPLPKYERTVTRQTFYDRVLSEIRALPGVRNAAYISFLPMVMGGGIWKVEVNGVADSSRPYTASMRYVTPGFFATMGIPLHQGRDVSERDTTTTPYAAVVSTSFARRYWPGADPIGRHFTMAFHDRMVVGVVGDVKVRGLERTSEPQVYLPYRQVEDGSFPFYVPKDLVVLSSGPSPVAAIRRLIHAADPEQSISNVRSMAEIVALDSEARTVQVDAIASFAAIAFVLAAIGIHGLLAFAVSERRGEFGVRIALGAQRGNILGMVLRQAALLAAAGIVPGALAAYASGRAMTSLLAGVRPDDALAFACAAALVAVMTLAGSLLPAMRAIRVDPIQAIRAD
jgi:predicted permease